MPFDTATPVLLAEPKSVADMPRQSDACRLTARPNSRLESGDRGHYADPRGTALARADAIVRGMGRAARIADAATAFNPPLRNLRKRLLQYAWATRNCGSDDIRWFRDLARNAVRCYRALRR